MSLLKGFELRQQGRVVELPMSAQRLLAFLALQERPRQRLYVAGQIWIDSSQDRANGNLRTTLWRLRRPSGGLVAAHGGELELAPDTAVDIRDIAACARRVLDHRPERDDGARLVAAGDLLPDWYDDWLVIERERFRQLRLLALEALCRDLAASGPYAAAMQAGLEAVAGEPLRESAHRVVIEAHLASGNVADALHQYGLFRELLKGRLGLEPSAALDALVAGIRRL
jgi:DNA-binding SARP family transcriptional activator